MAFVLLRPDDEEDKEVGEGVDHVAVSVGEQQQGPAGHGGGGKDRCVEPVTQATGKGPAPGCKPWTETDVVWLVTLFTSFLCHSYSTYLSARLSVKSWYASTNRRCKSKFHVGLNLSCLNASS